MSKLQVQDWANANSHSPSLVDKITVGAAIIRTTRRYKEIRLLKRNANEAYYPNVFEIPGGKVDTQDTCILDAIVREVVEETNLEVSAITAALPTLTYITRKMIRDAAGKEVAIVRRALQLGYVVSVCAGRGLDFCVNTDEHSMGIWAGLDSLEEVDMTSEMRGLVLEALTSTLY